MSQIIFMGFELLVLLHSLLMFIIIIDSLIVFVFSSSFSSG